MAKKEAKLRRATKTRAKISELKVTRLSVHRTPRHIYTQLIAPNTGKVLAAASTVEPDIKKEVENGGNISAAKIVGKYIAERGKKAGVTEVAFDRSGFKYHGRIQALAESARENGLKF